ncbi:protein of unknown function [Microbacterium sp. Nx66]|nr:protein of unknown function [Microbacterium sp. Nx66]
MRLARESAILVSQVILNLLHLTTAVALFQQVGGLPFDVCEAEAV